MSKYKYEKEFMFSNHRWEQIDVFLESQEQPLDLTKIRDAHRNTVLHHTAYHNQPKVMELYLKYYRKQLQNKMHTLSEIRQMTRQFLDQSNHEGYTAVHYAAYRGNIAVMKLVEKYEGNFKLTNYMKMGALHLAAQGDKVASLLYLHPLGLPINLTDAKLSTPLHWASFSNSEQIVQYLLARGAEFNCQDLEGLTPLHLATTYGNTRIVKMLLLAGADRLIRDNKGLTPIQIARQRQFQRIQKMLDDQYECLDRIKIVCNAKTKYQPTHKSNFFPAAFVMTSLLISAIIFGMVQFIQNWSLIMQSSLLGITIVLFLLLTFGKNLQMPLQKNYQMFSESGRLHRLCMFCVKQMHPREHHCPICQCCIPQYDHHCTWINSCIGRHNLAKFIFFLIVLEGTLLWLSFIGICMIANLGGENGLIKFRPVIEDQKWMVYLSIVILEGLSLGFGVPLMVLIFVQCKNLLLGKTTYQRFSKAHKSILTKQSALINDHIEKPSKMKMKNCWEMCFGSEGGKGDQCSSTTTSFIGEV